MAFLLALVLLVVAASPAAAMAPAHEVVRPPPSPGAPVVDDRAYLEQNHRLGAGPNMLAAALLRERAPHGTEARGQLNCAGTFIAPGLVLTAAHCFFGPESKRPIPDSRHTKTGGDSNAVPALALQLTRVTEIFVPRPEDHPQWYVATSVSDGRLRAKWRFMTSFPAADPLTGCTRSYWRPEQDSPGLVSAGRVAAYAMLRDPRRPDDKIYDLAHDLALVLVEPTPWLSIRFGAGEFTALDPAYLPVTSFGGLMHPADAAQMVAHSALIQKNKKVFYENMAAPEWARFQSDWGAKGWVLEPKVTSCSSGSLPSCAWTDSARLVDAILGFKGLMAGLVFDERNSNVKCDKISPNGETCEQLAQKPLCNAQMRPLDEIRGSALVHEAATPVMSALVVFDALESQAHKPMGERLGSWIQNTAALKSFAKKTEVRGLLYDPLARRTFGAPQPGDSGGGLWIGGRLAGVLHAGGRVAQKNAPNCIIEEDDQPGLQVPFCSTEHRWTPVHPHIEWIKEAARALLWFHKEGSRLVPD